MNFNDDHVIFEDDDDDESCSALTEDVSDAMHGTPFSPVVFEPRKDYGPQRSLPVAYRGGQRQQNNHNNDAMMLAQSRQIHRGIARGVRVRNSEFSRGEDSNMGYLPSRHFHQFVVETQPRPSLERDHNMSSLSNWSEIQSPSNESQNTISTIRSNRSVATMRSRRTMVSQKSSTSVSILHGEVINLEGQAAFLKSANPGWNHDSSSDDQYHLSGMEIGGGGGGEGGVTFQSSRRMSGGHLSFESSHGFSSMHQERYQGNGSDPVFTFGNASEHILKAQKHAMKFRKDAKKGVQKMKGQATSVAQRIMTKYYRPPLSPRSKELKDLEYLKKSHKEQFKQLKVQNGNDMDEDESFFSQSRYNGDNDEDFFDFVIVLTPQNAYEYWSKILDFREEYLGLDSADVWERKLDSPGASIGKTETRSSDGNSPEHNGIFNRSPLSEDSDGQHGDISTPLTGLLRRKRLGSTPTISKTPSRRLSSQVSRIFDSHQKSRFSHLRSPFEGTPYQKRNSRLSMFERAIQTPTQTSDRRSYSQQSYYSHSQHTASQSVIGKESGTVSETPMTSSMRAPISTVRRRFGNQANPSIHNKKHISTPPVRSLKRSETETEEFQMPLNDSMRSDAVKKVLKVDVNKSTEGEEENENPNILRTVEDMPNPTIPRGFAARGNEKFLIALQDGIVLRRHRPNKEAVFCRLISDNDGETIRYQVIGSEEAMVALKSQRIRYNPDLYESTSPTSLRATCAPWSFGDGPSDSSVTNKFIPDHVASQKYREKFHREKGVFKHLLDVAVNDAYSGGIDVKDIVALHPATKFDPRWPSPENRPTGTASLRRSLSQYDSDFTFSLILSGAQPFRKSPSDNLTETWQSGQGNEHLFRSLDFEAATEGEYWLVLRGLLRLYRDPMKKANGIGGGVHTDIDEGDTGKETRLRVQDKYVEPSTVGCIEKLFVKTLKIDDDYIRGRVMPEATPPPSDYFLGFKSPGTQIWSRLRWAGLETQRVFSADPRKVMLKIRCPEDRLTDLAEVLRLKMKTKEGSYAPFHEEAAHIFKSHDDHLDIPNMYRGGMASLLRSKDRQTIIDFIIGSRIRDSGAELSQTSPIATMIEAKVPLHMPRKLDSLYNSWVLYWKREHWTGIEESDLSRSSSVEEGQYVGGDGEEEKGKDRRPVPNILTRFFVEAFNQPLDAIEDYFGEQVTFYFAWMQHCSIHLLVLALFGLIVTLCQVTTDDYDHWLLPWWSMAVMLWTFTVLLNWRKRSNALAYQWGSMNIKEVETNRPEFYGKYMRDPITDEWVIKYPRWKRWLKYMISWPISLFFTGLSMFLILIVHANRDLQMARYLDLQGYAMNSTFTMNTTSSEFDFEFTWRNIGAPQLVGSVPVTKELLLDPTYWVIMFAYPCMLGLCIPILNIILMHLAVALNNFENYRTDAEYRTALIVKVFGFRFVSQFGTVYYYAFMAADISTDTAFENGMIRMFTSLMIYTTVAHWWNIILQVYVFMGIRNIRHYFYRKRLRKELKRVELLTEEYEQNERCDVEVRQIRLINERILLDQAQDELWMEVMCPPHDSFPEYITAVVQFSFVACFSFVLPCIPFLVLINYLLSMRFDAYKVCKVRRRPLAKRTGGIGVWEQVLHIVAVIAVLTNCWLVAFFHSGCRELLDMLPSTANVFIVVAWEHIMLFIKYLMGRSISTLPKSIRDQIKEKEHENENKQYENMRFKTEQTRRLKREKSMSGSFQMLAITPDSTARGGSSIAPREPESILTTPVNGSRLQTIESFEEPVEDRSIASSKLGEPFGSMPVAGNNFNGGYAIPHTSTPETSGRFQANESFEKSYNDLSIAKSNAGGLYASAPSPQRIEGFEKEHDETPMEDSFMERSFNPESFTPSKPGELFEC